jgi:hypothetical protein
VNVPRVDRRSLARPAHGRAPAIAPRLDDELETDAARLEHAVAVPAEASPRELLALQRRAGNAAVAELVGDASIGPAGGTASVQRDEWGKQYRTRRARPGALTYDEYKARIGQPGESEKFAPPLQAASEWGGTRLEPIAMTREELGAILLPERPNDPAAVAAHEQRLDDYLPDINAAFEIMEIDTVEAQADYLGHTAGESGTMSKLAEVGAEKREYAPFIGRGPVQVTWESGYVQTLAYLETQAERLAQQAVEADATEAGASGDGGAPAGGGATLRTQADLARRAVEAIKRDPAEAANPEFAFLFSAAFMQMAGGVRSTARLGETAGFAGNAAEDRWVTGRSTSFATGMAKAIAAGDDNARRDMQSALNRARIKRETYARAVRVLMPRAVREPEAAAE